MDEKYSFSEKTPIYALNKNVSFLNNRYWLIGDLLHNLINLLKTRTIEYN